MRLLCVCVQNVETFSLFRNVHNHTYGNVHKHKNKLVFGFVFQAGLSRCVRPPFPFLFQPKRAQHSDTYEQRVCSQSYD